MASPNVLPQLVTHCDWGTNAKKRWMVRAALVGGKYLLSAPELVGELSTLLIRLRGSADPDSLILVGFDFAIGLPKAYAISTEIHSFPGALRDTFGRVGKWSEFFDVCRESAEITRFRPFYPRSAKKKGERKKSHLVAALGVATFKELFRRCERATNNRREAGCVFWTLGANQVGKSAISGWRDVIAPALRAAPHQIKLWPFEGNLAALLSSGRTILVETYPTEAYRHLDFPDEASNKQEPTWRQARADEILRWSASRPVSLSEEARRQVLDGFGAAKDGEDRFDAFVGACSMLEVVLGYREEGAPHTEDVRAIEGWIFGLKPETDGPIQLLGYSERGLFNALFFCLRHHHHGVTLLQKLLSRARWPGLGDASPSFGPCETIFVEQSFSRFGTADGVLLMRNGERRQCLFIEGKRGGHRLVAAWNEFRGSLRGELTVKNLSSNLFSQLYFKQRLAAELSRPGDWKSRLQVGISFPECLSPKRRPDALRKIGNNPVVLDAAGRLRDFAADSYFLAIVPESPEAAQEAWKNFSDCPIDGWNLRQWGFLTLPEIRDFCREHVLVDVLELLRFNRNQLFS